MLTRLIHAAVGVVGVVLVLLGVASATLWRADDVLRATATARTPLVVTDLGVLELGGDPVTVRVTAPGGAPVVLAVGRDTDVAGWVGTDAVTRVTGLSDWDTLATTTTSTATPTPTAEGSASPAPSESAEAPAEGEAAAVADPAGSDLWVVQATGEGSAELVWPAQEGRWTLLAAAPGGERPTISLAWPRVVTTPWLWPLVVSGAVLVLLSAVLLARGVARARRREEPLPVTTGSLPVVTDPDGVPLTPTRRRLREAEEAARREAGTRRPRTGEVPIASAGAVATAAAAAASLPDEAGPDEVTRSTVAPGGPVAEGAQRDEEVALPELAPDEVALPELAADEVAADEVAPDEVAADEAPGGVTPAEQAPANGADEGTTEEVPAEEGPADERAADQALLEERGVDERPAGGATTDGPAIEAAGEEPTEPAAPGDALVAGAGPADAGSSPGGATAAPVAAAAARPWWRRLLGAPAAAVGATDDGGAGSSGTPAAGPEDHGPGSSADGPGPDEEHDPTLLPVPAWPATGSSAPSTRGDAWRRTWGLADGSTSTRTAGPAADDQGDEDADAARTGTSAEDVAVAGDGHDDAPSDDATSDAEPDDAQPDDAQPDDAPSADDERDDR
ncbi:hypothetical protein [Cellulomonas marina]|uniref:Uncharacterized protein n=1 Tax=Cellulomonas marina TaxID=988821 RepID=A0A1I1ATA2_9CELL|nr:hypothetical protein [Cellulomonas marina]GIG30229.1 hypothetical protein Cma02nite_28290 [Cellulomonas marina]SFB41305.1 hypothetical protein SAMN05421867_12246 [Cellulomonas marina]